MIVISVINYKGGVGKSTITANLAADLAARGQKVLCIDLDPQTNLTFSFVSVPAWIEQLKDNRTIKSWYDSFIKRAQTTGLDHLIFAAPHINLNPATRLDLISSHLGLINVDLELAVMLGGASKWQRRNNYLTVYSLLKNGLEELNRTTHYDIVLIDCPPNFNIVTKSAIIASDSYLVPARPDYLSTLGIEELQNHVEKFVDEYNEIVAQDNDEYQPIAPKMLGVIFNMVTFHDGKAITTQRNYIEQVKRKDILCFETMLRENKTVYSVAPESGVPVALQSLKGSTTYVSVSNELKSLTDEFLQKVGWFE